MILKFILILHMTKTCGDFEVHFDLTYDQDVTVILKFILIFHMTKACGDFEVHFDLAYDQDVR